MKSLASMRTANREKPLPHNFAVSRQVYVHASSASMECRLFLQHMAWYGPTSCTVWMQRRQKNCWSIPILL